MARETPHETEPAYLTIRELSVRTQLSVTQLRRMAQAGQITFFQPGGHGGRLLFPPDAIERGKFKTDGDQHQSPKPLSGARPKWMDP